MRGDSQQREGHDGEDNLLEVMQFVFNHTTFDPKDDNDQALLAAYKPLGVEPGKAFDPNTVAQIDGQEFRAVAQAVARQALARAVVRFWGGENHARQAKTGSSQKWTQERGQAGHQGEAVAQCC